MAFSNLRGAPYDIDIVASVGINEDWTVVDADENAVDLTGYTISAVIKDDREEHRAYGGEYGTETTIAQTITDAANGQFDFIILPANFRNKEGGRLTYELRQIDDSGNYSCLASGYINVLERG